MDPARFAFKCFYPFLCVFNTSFCREKLSRLLSKEKKLLGLPEKSTATSQPSARAVAEIRPLSKPQSAAVLSPDELDSSRFNSLYLQYLSLQ